VLGADESGMRTAGKAWLHVLENPLLSWLGVHSKCGHEAFDEFGLMPDFDGTLAHDGFVSIAGQIVLGAGILARQMESSLDGSKCDVDFWADCTQSKKYLGWKATTSLKEGIEKTWTRLATK